MPREDEQRLPLGEREQELVAALRQTEAGFREFIDCCPDAVFVRRGQIIVHVNDALLDVLRLERNEVLGRDPVMAFVHPDHRGAVLEHRVNRPHDTDLRQHRWVRKDGELLFMEIVGVTVTFEGAPARIVMCRDVTERKRMQARLMGASQLASIGTLAAGIAHEINNPLASVLANLQLVADELSQRPGDQGELSEILSDALAGVTRVRNVVAAIRSFSQPDNEEPEPLELRRLIDAAVDLASTMIRDRARLLGEYQGVFYVNATRSQLIQAIVNLLINAAQAIPEGRSDRSEIRIDTRAEGPRRVVLSIRDTGAGIPPENLPRVFGPFFTTTAIGGA